MSVDDKALVGAGHQDQGHADLHELPHESLSPITLAAGIGLLSALLIGHALMPARGIVAGLKRLENGDFSHRLPAYRAAVAGALLHAAAGDAAARVGGERGLLPSDLFPHLRRMANPE